MDKNTRIIAITRILPGLQNFLSDVLANESLSTEAERQRLEIIKELEGLTKPPVLPPRPANLKSQSRTSVDSIESADGEKDFASVQRKLSNIFYLRRDFEEINEHLVNGIAAEEGAKNTSKKTPGKSNHRKKDLGGIYEDLQHQEDAEEFEVLSEEETSRANRSLSLTRGTNFRASLGKSKWFTRKEKSIAHDVFVGDLLLPTIAGHLMEVRTNKRRWCVLKDQHLYIFKNQEEPAYFVIDLPGCDISTVPKGDKSKVSYSFKITQNGVAAVILGIEEEKDLSAWMNALITASVAKNPLSPPHKLAKTIPRGMSATLDDDTQSDARRHTFGSYPYKTKDIFVDIDLTNYEHPTDIMGIEPLDIENYNPPLPPLPGEIDELLEMDEEQEGVARYQIYEEVTEELLESISKNKKPDEDSGIGVENDKPVRNDEKLKSSEENLAVDNELIVRQSYSEVATSDSEYSSDEDLCTSERLFHDRWALHSGVLYQKRATGWNRLYCKIVDNTFKGFRNPDDQSPMLEMNLSGFNVRAAEAEGKRKFIFQINLADEECLYFNTDTKDSLERWIEVISIAATSRPDNSLNLSEEELEKSAVVTKVTEEHNTSRDITPVPVPERVQSLRRSRVLAESDGRRNKASDHEESQLCIEVKQPESSSKNEPELNDQEKENSEKQTKDQTENKSSEENLNAENAEKRKETRNNDVWQRRSDKRNYHTAPRLKTPRKKLQPISVNDSSKNEKVQNFSKKAPTSPQYALHISKKSQYAERLKKYLDAKGQFSGFILELTIEPNSTNLTRRWAVVQNGFLRIYEDYGCAAPFLRISLVEAFLKDFTNLEKDRYCFMLEYGAGQSIMLLTNTHQELKRWITVITLSIACHTDLFGSGLDIRSPKTKRVLNSTENISYEGAERRISEPATDIARTNTTSSGKIDKPKVTPGEVSGQTEVTSSDSCSRLDVMSSTNGCEGSSAYDACDVRQEATSVYDTCSGQEVTSEKLTNGGYCECRCEEDDGKVIKKVLHHKSYDMTSANSWDSDEAVGETSPETFTYRSSPGAKYSGYLRVTRGTDASLLQFCELKGSLFSIYENEKCENRKELFNLLYDKYQELPNKEIGLPNKEIGLPNKEIGLPNKEIGLPNKEIGLPNKEIGLPNMENSVPIKEFSFTIKNDSDGVVRFDCEDKKDYKIWRKVLSHAALQDNSSSERSSKTSSPRCPKKLTNDSPSSRKRSSFRASVVEEESKHHEVLREINEGLAKGVLECDCSEYKCHVYEVRDSSGNKTIIRRWCVINNGAVRIYERETSREAVTELKQSTYCVKDVENPGDFPFAIQLELIQKADTNSDGVLVIQASNVNDFRELLKRLKVVCKQKLTQSRSESHIQTEKKNFKKLSPLTHSKSDLSIRKEVKRIFSLARKTSKSDILADVPPLGHDTWPKVTRRERKSSRRALSDTSTERPVTYSMIEDTSRGLGNRKSNSSLYDPDEHYTGYLTEVRNSELCRSEVRKWCVLHEYKFSASDDKGTQSPTTVIDLRTTQLVDMSHVYKNSFEFRVNNGVVQSYLYRAATDFEKWVMLLNEAICDYAQMKKQDGRLGFSPKSKDTAKKDAKLSQSSVGSHEGEDTAF